MFRLNVQIEVFFRVLASGVERAKKKMSGSAQRCQQVKLKKKIPYVFTELFVYGID